MNTINKIHNKYKQGDKNLKNNLVRNVQMVLQQKKNNVNPALNQQKIAMNVKMILGDIVANIAFQVITIKLYLDNVINVKLKIVKDVIK